MPQDTWFDIVIPVYRLNKEVITSISSVLTSKYSKFNIILGLQNEPKSSDELKYYESLKNNSKVNMVDCYKSSSLPQTLNLSLRNCESPWAVRHDDDDLMHPSRLLYLKEIIENSKKIPTIIGQQIRYFSWVKGVNKALNQAGWCKQNLDDFELKQSLLLMPCFYHPAITLNLNKIKYHYNENYIYAQDYKLYVDNIEDSIYAGSQTSGTYYQVKREQFPNAGNEAHAQNKKRQMQLQFHEKIMIEMWRKIGIKLSSTEARIIRVNLVTSEESRGVIASRSSYDKSIEKLNKAKLLFKRFYNSGQ